uniref:Heparan-sulfate 6-O-sulfotransferase n=1 Tax=Gouania willdenowi TaxID=441366 RepID=A0A8C5E2U1_GOUWI
CVSVSSANMDERSGGHHRLIIVLLMVLLRRQKGWPGIPGYRPPGRAPKRPVHRRGTGLWPASSPDLTSPRKQAGTTFGRHLVRNIQLERPCECHAGQKKCTCLRPGKKETWLFSRFSTGWSCGLHADWTELTSCVPTRMDSQEVAKNLPRPLVPLLSEWRHVQRGATWKASLHVCEGRSPTLSELPNCYPGDDWSGCSLQEFIDCQYNLANNRQTRMLADLSLVGCYNVSTMSEDERWAVLLESAKRNLRGMAFFGLTEYQRKTQYLFERTFNLEFIAPFTQLNGTRAASVDVPPQTQHTILQLNKWDVQLYEYARDLFLQRFQVARQQERRQARERRQQERRRLRGRVGVTQGRQLKPTETPHATHSRAAEWSCSRKLLRTETILTCCSQTGGIWKRI